MVLLLTVLSGIAWTIVYIDSIGVGFKQKTYTMSIAALGLNTAWEWTYAVRDLTHHPRLQAWVNLIWALADVVILATHFRYGRSELSRSPKTGLQPYAAQSYRRCRGHRERNAGFRTGDLRPWQADVFCFMAG